MLDARFLAWLVPMPCLSPCGCYTPCRPRGDDGRRRSMLMMWSWMPDEDSNLD